MSERDNLDGVAIMPMQSEYQERILRGIEGIIYRMTRISAGGILCLVDYDARELAIEILGYIRGIKP